MAFSSALSSSKTADSSTSFDVALDRFDSKTPSPLPVSSIPGPGADLDVAAYNTLKHDYVRQLHEKYGGIFKIEANSAAHIDPDDKGPKKTIFFVSEVEAVRDILNADDRFAKTWDAADRSSSTVDYVHNLVQPCLANTVFNATMDKGESSVHHGRVLMKRTFAASERFIPEVEACLDHMIRNELESWTGDRVDVQKFVHDVIRRVLLVPACGGTVAIRAAEMIQDVFHETMEYFVERYNDGSHKVDVTQEDSERLAKLEAAMLEVVKLWRSLGGSSLESVADKYCLLHVMDKGGFDDEAMARMLVNTVIAGGEAPAIALSGTLEELAYQPNLQDRLYAEVSSLAGPSGPVHRHIIDGAMKLVNSNTLEGLRLRAPATLVMRMAIKDTQLCGYSIPRGSTVGVCVSAVHAREELFSKPDDFAPESRPSLDYVVVRNEAPFLPFSAGPRGCPGKHIGTALIRTSMAKLVQHLRFEPPATGKSNDGKRPAKFAAWMSNGIWLRVTRREQRSRL
eukprot:TRINITY_DN14223_c0_g1_i2.p1 TRINITY_DN14223_c0_g1~~TRINITY_DN14223_c0_g1_i2.p1  ORF type:complete len:524 (+),score=121.06 TRINITY_DN14223_c0_g1_i2:41-1573(+)